MASETNWQYLGCIIDDLCLHIVEAERTSATICWADLPMLLDQILVLH